MTEIIREIDEELQAKRYKELAKKYGKYIVAVIALIAISFGSYGLWQTHTENLRNERASAFGVLINDIETPAESWIEFASTRKDAFSTLAWRFAAATYIQDGKPEQASEILQNLSVSDSNYGSFTTAMTQILKLNAGQEVSPLGENTDAFAAFSILAEAERLLSSGDKSGAIALLESNNSGIDSSLQTLFFELAEALKTEL